jgi:hypothetical protein
MAPDEPTPAAPAGITPAGGPVMENKPPKPKKTKKQKKGKKTKKESPPVQ